MQEEIQLDLENVNNKIISIRKKFKDLKIPDIPISYQIERIKPIKQNQKIVFVSHIFKYIIANPNKNFILFVNSSNPGLIGTNQFNEIEMSFWVNTNLKNADLSNEITCLTNVVDIFNNKFNLIVIKIEKNIDYISYKHRKISNNDKYFHIFEFANSIKNPVFINYNFNWPTNFYDLLTSNIEYLKMN